MWYEQTKVVVQLEHSGPGSGPGKVIIGPSFTPNVKEAAEKMRKHIEELSQEVEAGGGVQKGLAAEQDAFLDGSDGLEKQQEDAVDDAAMDWDAPVGPPPDEPDLWAVNEDQKGPPPPSKFIVVKSIYQTPSHGVAYRLSKDPTHMANCGAKWN